MKHLPSTHTDFVIERDFAASPARRIVFACDIRLDTRLLSVSLVTVDFSASRRGTRMVYTEQLACLDGHEDRAQRRRATEESLDRLGSRLRAPAGIRPGE